MSAPEALRQQILQEVAQAIAEVIGDEWVSETPITMETSFGQDLEVESIELVALSEKLQARYGATIDFPSWLAGMQLEEIIGLTVGQLVDYIASCQSK
jgi:acyl carrier protein